MNSATVSFLYPFRLFLQGWNPLHSVSLHRKAKACLPAAHTIHRGPEAAVAMETAPCPETASQTLHVSSDLSSFDISLTSLNHLAPLHRWSGRNNRGKIGTHVTFGEDLDLSPFCHPKLSQNSLGYRLSAVVMHHGRGFGCGHYTAYCWNHEAGEWVALYGN